MQEHITIKTAGAMDIKLPIAAAGSRSYAFLIDWHIRLLLALAWFFLVVLLLMWVGSFASFASVSILEEKSLTLFGIIGLLPAIVIYSCYHLVLEIVMKGRTPGKRMAGVRIVTIEGHTPSVGALLLRNVFRLIDSLPIFYMLGLTVVFLTPKQVRIGDIAARTLLVYEDKPKTHALEALGGIAQSSGLTHAQIEVLQELLERWRELERNVKARLATQFLESIGERVPELKRSPSAKLVRQLHQRLVDVQQGKHG